MISSNVTGFLMRGANAQVRFTTLYRRVLIFVLLSVFFFRASPASASEPSINLDTLLQDLRSGILPQQGMEFVWRVYSTDRWFNFEKFAETAQYLKAAMQQIGLKDVEIGKPPADGVTQAGFWTMPLAWDVSQARLEIVDPALPPASRVLCDYQRVPTSLGEWSGPTPPGGITAEVVEVKDWPPARIARMDLHGKLAMTDENPAPIKWALVKAGALGAINASSENPSLQDARQWMNAWGDYGWAFIKGSTPLLYFSITPREAALVRNLIAQHGSVRVKATVNSHYYAGVYPYTTGVIPGTGPEEVLALGHTAEEGAGDNASGVAALMEAMATLNRMIMAGKLPKPERTIRILAMPEMYGSMSYIKAHPDRIRRTVAAICLDTPAGMYDLAGSIYTFYMNPQVASSYTDAFILKVADEYFSKIGRPWNSHAFETGTDSYLGDPTIGVPTVWAYSGNDVNTPHHSSADTPKRVDPRSLRDLSIVTAAYLYYVANAGKPEAIWLAQVAQQRGYGQVLSVMKPFLDRMNTANSAAELGLIVNEGLEKLHYTVGRQSQAVLSVTELVPREQREGFQTSLTPLLNELQEFGRGQSERLQAAAAERARTLGISSPIRPVSVQEPQQTAASAIVVKRLRFGTIPLDQVAPDRRDGYPSGAWDLVPITALYWCDGNRNLAEVIHLTQMELGPTKFNFVGYFRFLRDHGFVEFVKGR
ncbi:MAG: M28 family peptidase [Terriglobia bacterium]